MQDVGVYFFIAFVAQKQYETPKKGYVLLLLLIWITDIFAESEILQSLYLLPAFLKAFARLRQPASPLPKKPLKQSRSGGCFRGESFTARFAFPCGIDSEIPPSRSGKCWKNAACWNIAVKRKSP